MTDITTVVATQRAFFRSGQSKNTAFRKEQLKALQRSIKIHESEIFDALKADLNKYDFEAYATELGLVYGELRHMLRHLDGYAKTKRVRTPIVHFPARSAIYREPYGCVLIMSPWNYPFQLAMIPLIGALAAGNCVVVKPSNYAKATSRILTQILGELPRGYVDVVEGGRVENQALLDHKFDYIFFTGSPAVGKLVMERAAQHLTPVTLELGGKSPCIVDRSARIDLAARRIVWGKLVNSGQTCVAPDYFLVHEQVRDELIVGLKKYIHQFYGAQPEQNIEYPAIINDGHLNRLCALLARSDDVWGGAVNGETRQLAPAIVVNADWNSPTMEEELFGPIFPILTYTELDETLEQINDRPTPLALYCFSEDVDVQNRVISTVRYGGGCINDTIIHLANHNLPFGGAGESGMGSYHGARSFETFSHEKSVLKRGTWIDIPVRYAPYGVKIRILRKLL